MRLPRPFFRLPVRFDAARLSTEVLSLPESAWAAHPNALAGNSSVRLISVDGGENDAVDGPMLPTSHLAQLPYVRQVLASFGVVWSRSRLMRLAPAAGVPPHADINHHWFNRVRLHIPVITRPEVTFHCGDEVVHMAAGEAWVFDNWRPHRVDNPTAEQRIHLVADTSGSANFWQFVARADHPDIRTVEHRFDPAQDPALMTERQAPPRVMHPAEVDILVADLRSELTVAEAGAAPGLAVLQGLLDGFCRDWRQVYALLGDGASDLSQFTGLRDALRDKATRSAPGLAMRTNGTAALRVLEARVLQHLLRPATPLRRRRIAAGSLIDRPVFIVAAPRSGSTLLFETLAATPQLATLGGEAHWLVEGIGTLRPGSPEVDSNRLTASHATDDVALHIEASLAERLAAQRTRNGAPLRLLEKTPKNALRIPFFDSLYPDARFIFLWRDPRENIASILEAWRSGNWVTYPSLDGWDGPWSLLLPPHWQALRGAALADVAAWQWGETNRIICSDLATLAPQRWTTLSYADLLGRPVETLQRLAAFIDIEMDTPLCDRGAAALPLSRYTLTPPDPDKWRRHTVEIERVLPRLQDTWRQLQALRKS